MNTGTAEFARAWALMAVDSSTLHFATAVQIRSDVCVKAEQDDNLMERGRVSKEHVLSMGGPISVISSGSLLFVDGCLIRCWEEGRGQKGGTSDTTVL